jgi:hypothetical protein
LVAAFFDPIRRREGSMSRMSRGSHHSVTVIARIVRPARELTSSERPGDAVRRGAEILVDVGFRLGR